MPAYLKSSDNLNGIQVVPTSGMAALKMPEQSARHITVGLVNNMPDGALESTERQFVSLLNAASGDRPVVVRLFSMPDICRKKSAASRLRAFYSDVEFLWNTRLDAIIVTGREPLAPHLREESYWGSFQTLVEWARENTYSAVWSCLAAHAAVLYCDDVERIGTDAKQCGVFNCSLTDDHLLTAGLPSKFKLPHSRWNGVQEGALKRSGYRVLSWSEVGPDLFTKQYRSLFVFFQGHPEYDSNTLMLEYRRDVGRFLKGESKVYPSIPRGYFDEEMVAVLEEFREEAVRCTRRDLLAKLDEKLASAKIEAPWRNDAIRMYRNWLEYIAAQKESHPFAKADWNKVSMIPIGAGISGDYLRREDADQRRTQRIAGAR